MHKNTKVENRWNRFQASIRDTIILFQEFRSPLFWFSVAVIGGGILYNFISTLVNEPINDPMESVYIVLTATFLQTTNRDFPNHLALQVFHFFMPFIGVILLSQGLADFGTLLFNRHARTKEWEMAVASTLKKHIVLIGFGHLGFRIALKLHEMGKQIVVIEQNPKLDTLNEARRIGIPVITDDATRQITLEGANVKRAETIILASQNDAMNLQIALKARGINPDIKVVVRIFDDDFAHALQDQFGFIALSATEMAAPVFAAAAAGVDVTNPISVEGRLLSLARLTLTKESPLINKTVDYVENNYKVNVVLFKREDETQMPPKDNVKLNVGDVIAIIGGPEELNIVLHNKTNERR
ncbi:MAG TPA: hypothetical protein DHW49_04685 [Anaerolineae bacterium]|nr:hypothetical protein [Anaerolineae bacterium]